MNRDNLLLLILALLLSANSSVAEDLKGKFNAPSNHNQTSIYWYWINGNMSVEGVERDLDAMKSAGINRAYIGYIGMEEGTHGPEVGECVYWSQEWWDILHAALKQAGELGIEIGLFNGQGWSQSGGPWITPDRSMRYLKSYEYQAKGGKIEIAFNGEDSGFQPLGVIAYPKPDKLRTPAPTPSKISCSYPIENLANLMDSDTTTHVIIPKDGVVDIIFDKRQKVSTISVVAAMSQNVAYCQLEYKDTKSGEYLPIRKFDIIRYNYNTNVGFDPDAPVVVSFEQVEAKEFRIIFDLHDPNLRLSDILFYEVPQIDSYPEKTLAKMYQSHLPTWSEYQWEYQGEQSSRPYAIDPSMTIDLSASVEGGKLKATLPKGEWIIAHYGMLSTMVTNQPSFPDATGLEVDKMNREHVAYHFDKYIGEVLRRVPAEDRTTFKYVISDSYETGGQNFTDNMFEEFEEEYGYDPKPFLPVFNGVVVGSVRTSDRFLWDVRRLVAKKIAYDYVGGLRDVSHEHGFTLWLENYGHWGFPAEFLQYGGQSDELGGEFWSTGPNDVTLENRAAISAAHIYGKNTIYSESFTAGWDNPYSKSPKDLKLRGDLMFSQGINSNVLHVYITQADDRVPGINTWFGNEFSRSNTWFSHIDLFVDYLKRTGLMLQQGSNVADIAFYVGEDAPKMTGIQEPALPNGYEYDYMNSEVIVRDMRVEDGYLVLPHGARYRVLVLPPMKTMRPEVIEKLYSLIEQGATVLGDMPLYSPSNENQPMADRIIAEYGSKMWGSEPEKRGKRSIGKGALYVGYTLEQLFEDISLAPDMESGTERIFYSHRACKDRDIYYVTNQSDSPQDLSLRFRTTNSYVECWNPVTCQSEYISSTIEDGRVAFSRHLTKDESLFFIFNKCAPASMHNSAEFSRQDISKDWDLAFKNDDIDIEKSIHMEELSLWNKSDEWQIRHYSGTVNYTKSITVDGALLEEASKVELSIEKLADMAKVYINDRYVGGAWTLPYSVDLTYALRSGENHIRIEVVNKWANRLIGELSLPESERKTFLSQNSWSKESPLEDSGIEGEISIIFKK